MGIHATRPGASDSRTVDRAAHAPLDRAVPRAGHRVAFAPFEGSVEDVRDSRHGESVRTPDARILDPVLAPPARPARFPIAFTVRRGAFVAQPFLGNRLPLQRAGANPDPLQSMEPSPTARRNTFRITPIPWDQQLVEGTQP